MISSTINNLKRVFSKKANVILLILLALHIIFRFYQLESRMTFGYDQVDSAWAAKGIIVDHNFPLIGPSNKLNSGIYVGPLYYYLISIFYFFTNLDPIAAGIFAGVTSIIGFFIFFFIVKKLFSLKVALVGLALNVISFSAIQFDRVQWEINFIPLLSLSIFYVLYKIITGNEKFIVVLAILAGLAFHVHLTILVYSPLIILLCLPLFPRTKATIKYTLIAIPFFLIWLAPMAISIITSQNSLISQPLRYATDTFHGLHLTRAMQLIYDAFIQIESYFTFSILKPLSILMLPVFYYFYIKKNPSKKSFLLSYLILLWFIVPWVIMSLYSGEITSYYFAFNRMVALAVTSFALISLIEMKKTFITTIILLFAIYYLSYNLQRFFAYKTVGLLNYRLLTKDAIAKKKKIPFVEGKPASFLYYLYTRK